ncbi:ABC transporter ATP-binding protein [Paenibacillus faecalis]|uniref:ABC transporter ATP-binding protein n=1 Tax=Paenibacillus faecalis TaxID=2079532 RepID=UPI000D108E52|nr:ABC transporter ATP-binding protein [Paenibacillus faecalis]
MGQSIIELTGLTKKYGELTAVNQLNLSIQAGEIYGLLGPNGAGKSTTILMMLGLAEPTSGSVRVCGYNSTRQPLEVKRRVGYMPDDVGFYEDRTPLENLIYTARLNRIPLKDAKERAEKLIDRVGLTDAISKKVGTFSRGMRQRLGLADVLIKEPEVIILDEPTLGIDPVGVRDLLQLIQRLRDDEGITIVLCSHHLHQVQQICDRVGLFVKGQLLAEGDVPSLSAKLFAGEPVRIHVKADPISPSLFESLWDLDGVLNVKQTKEDQLEIDCQGNLAGVIAGMIIQSGAVLTHISTKEYGLDEIYHRYFEGGESGESNAAQAKAEATNRT